MAKIFLLLSLLIIFCATKPANANGDLGQEFLYHNKPSHSKSTFTTSSLYAKHTTFSWYHDPTSEFACKQDWFRIRARRANTQYAQGTLGYIHFKGHDAHLIPTLRWAAHFTLDTSGHLISEKNNQSVGAKHRGVAVMERQAKFPPIGNEWKADAKGLLELPGAEFCYNTIEQDLFIVTNGAATPKGCARVELVAECSKTPSSKTKIHQSQSPTPSSTITSSTSASTTSSFVEDQSESSTSSDASGDLEATRFDGAQLYRATTVWRDTEARATVVRRGATLTATWSS